MRLRTLRMIAVRAALTAKLASMRVQKTAATSPCVQPRSSTCMMSKQIIDTANPTTPRIGATKLIPAWLLTLKRSSWTGRPGPIRSSTSPNLWASVTAPLWGSLRPE
eukprot:2547304-Pyramimonas_sp.AAC.1